MNNLQLLTFSLAALAATLPTATASAQTPDNLIGITRVTPALRQYDHNNCSGLGQCFLPGLPGSALLPQYVGGTGWDAKRSGAWVSNGVLLAKYDDNCVTQCPPMVIPTLAANAFVTGIEVVVGMDQLWLIDNLGFLHFYTNTCPPNPIGMCNTGLGPTVLGNVTTGLAVDEGAGFIFISYPALPVGANTIAVLPMAAGCQVTQQFQVPPCAFAAFGPVFGLACDWGTGTLYGTDGSATVAISYLPGAATVFVMGATCCPPQPVNERMIGLAIRPGRATSNGQPCANGACANCPMNHTLRNDPLLGNANFQLGLDQAQPNTFAFCLIGSGPCQNLGVVVPPLCGPIFIGPSLGNLGPNITTGGFTPCDGTTSFNLPLPIVPGLAGQIFSSQCLTICFNAAGGFGTSLSNCLSWELQGQ